MNADKERPEIIGYWRDDGAFGEFILPTSGAIPEHGWKPVVLLEEQGTDIDMTQFAENQWFEIVHCCNCGVSFASTKNMCGNRRIRNDHRPTQGGEAVTDREIVELAAKAAGIQIVWYSASPSIPEYPVLATAEGKPTSYGWNPLTEDGDALRLAVKMGLAISIDSIEQETLAHHEQAIQGSPEKWMCHPTTKGGEEDRYAATRRAIVRAAAEIGTK